MMLLSWEDMPYYMKNDEVKNVYDVLKEKTLSLVLKRLFDILLSIILIIILSPVMLVISVWIKADSKGPAFFKQIRITQFGKEFNILKFRTMEESISGTEADLTVFNDNRITRAGRILRRFKLDELPQIFNILKGDMTFVGTRPEVVRYVKQYSEEMLATLLLPAGLTSQASIEFKNEEQMLSEKAGAECAETTYINNILPKKMELNLKYLRELSLTKDMGIIIKTIISII
ncbi:MAG: sugar transferase [Lachnospira sp.]